MINYCKLCEGWTVCKSYRRHNSDSLHYYCQDCRDKRDGYTRDVVTEYGQSGIIEYD